MLTKEKKRQLATNLSWMCKRDAEGKDCCPCLPQNSCPRDFGDDHCPATLQDWLDWMEKDVPEQEFDDSY